MPHSLSSLLKGHPAFRKLVLAQPTAAAQTQDSAPPANAQASLPLPDNLRDKVLLQEAGERMLLLVPNNAVAQILRFHLPRLQQSLGNKPLSIRIQPNLNQQTQLPKTERQLPQESARLLQNLAESCDHAGLADALRRLASFSDN